MSVVDATFVLRERQIQRRVPAAAERAAIGQSKVASLGQGTKAVPDGSLRHLTAEGRRAAQRRQQAAMGKSATQQRGGLQLRVAQLQHESVRLRQEQQRHAAFDAEKSRAEQNERMDKYKREQHQAGVLQQKMQQLATSAPWDPNAINAMLARSIAAKQSGAAVSSIFNAGYGYEDD